jgi:hypothetical protein
MVKVARGQPTPPGSAAATGGELYTHWSRTAKRWQRPHPAISPRGESLRIIKLLVGAAIVGGLAWAGYIQYQDPRVQELLGRGHTGQPRPAPTPPPGRSAPPRPARREPPVRKKEPPRAEPVRVPTPSPESAEANRQLGSTILGILAARKLASGISLTVTDEVVAVVGKVDQEEQKRGILDVLEKARGARRLDSSGLTVSTPDNP